MTRWLIELVGDRLDTEEIPYWFPDGDVFGVEKDGKHFLTGKLFDDFDDGGAVRAEAASAIRSMGAVISLLWPAFSLPQVGGVSRERDDGRVDVWMFPEGCRSRSKVRGVVSVAGGVATHPVRTQAQDLLQVARKCPHLNAAIEVWSDAFRSWSRLYRILEEIECHIGQPVSRAGFCSDNERDRFRRSANCSDVAGIDARHARGASPPPKRPMTLDDAENFIRGILDKALRGN